MPSNKSISYVVCPDVIVGSGGPNKAILVYLHQSCDAACLGLVLLSRGAAAAARRHDSGFAECDRCGARGPPAHSICPWSIAYGLHRFLDAGRRRTCVVAAPRDRRPLCSCRNPRRAPPPTNAERPEDAGAPPVRAAGTPTAPRTTVDDVDLVAGPHRPVGLGLLGDHLTTKRTARRQAPLQRFRRPGKGR